MTIEPRMNDLAREALERLLVIANRDSGQAVRVADFLLAWWNPQTCGKFDPTSLWACDSRIVTDVLNLLATIRTIPIRSATGCSSRPWHDAGARI